jgi:hypothetical protein
MCVFTPVVVHHNTKKRYCKAADSTYTKQPGEKSEEYKKTKAKKGVTSSSFSPSTNA